VGTFSLSLFLSLFPTLILAFSLSFSLFILTIQLLSQERTPSTSSKGREKDQFRVLGVMGGILWGKHTITV